MTKMQTSILLTPEEMHILDQLCQKEKMSKSALIGLAIVNFHRVKEIIRDSGEDKNEQTNYYQPT